jgi:hypothetical protein
LEEWRRWYKKPPPSPLQRRGREERNRKMKINRNNYESFFIDYLEGNLDEKLVDDFIEFLQQNPDLKEELSLFETVSVGQEEITFGKKELLLKEKYDIEKEFNQAAIASLEGEISPSEKVEFDNYLFTHPEKQKEAKLFILTKLQPDQSVVFNKKNNLYHYSTGKTILLWTTRAAAVIIFALTVYTFIDKSSNKIIPENRVAVIEKEPEKKINPSEIKEVPVKNNKVEEQKTLKKETEKPAVKSEKPKANETKIIRENSQGRLINDDLALARISEEIPELQSLSASVTTFSIPEMDLVPVKIMFTDNYEPVFEERLLVDIVKEKTGVDKLSFNKIVKSGLSLVASLSKEKFNYETDTEGKVTEVNFDSRLLAFSIPTNPTVQDKSEEGE